MHRHEVVHEEADTVLAGGGEGAKSHMRASTRAWQAQHASYSTGRIACTSVWHREQSMHGLVARKMTQRQGSVSQAPPLSQNGRAGPRARIAC